MADPPVAGLRVDVLGPVQIWWEDVAAPVEDPAARAVAAALATCGWLGHEELARHLRDDDAVAALPDVPGFLRRPVFALRHALALAGGGPDHDLVARRGDGWVLRVEPDGVDAHRFRRLADDGWKALREGAVADARDFLGDALGLWRGTPFDGLGHFDDLRDALAGPHRRARRGLLAARVDLGEAQAVSDAVAALAAEEPDNLETALLHALTLYRRGASGNAEHVIRWAEQAQLACRAEDDPPDGRLEALRTTIREGHPPPSAVAAVLGR
jgi:DNA-binding SARP family transcriptional activator